uniref:Uncharacterized protein n=1 Tax=Poecilia formosa TaxID=48698 RepID=A0A096LSK6_POEFO
MESGIDPGQDYYTQDYYNYDHGYELPQYGSRRKLISPSGLYDEYGEVVVDDDGSYYYSPQESDGEVRSKSSAKETISYPQKHQLSLFNILKVKSNNPNMYHHNDRLKAVMGMNTSAPPPAIHLPWNKARVGPMEVVQGGGNRPEHGRELPGLVGLDGSLVIDGSYFQTFTGASMPAPAKQRLDEAFGLISLARRMQEPTRVGDEHWSDRKSRETYGSVGDMSVSAAVAARRRTARRWEGEKESRGSMTEQSDSETGSGSRESPSEFSPSDRSSPTSSATAETETNESDLETESDDESRDEEESDSYEESGTESEGEEEESGSERSKGQRYASKSSKHRNVSTDSKRDSSSTAPRPKTLRNSRSSKRSGRESEENSEEEEGRGGDVRLRKSAAGRRNSNHIGSGVMDASDDLSPIMEDTEEDEKSSSQSGGGRHKEEDEDQSALPTSVICRAKRCCHCREKQNIFLLACYQGAAVEKKLCVRRMEILELADIDKSIWCNESLSGRFHIWYRLIILLLIVPGGRKRRIKLMVDREYETSSTGEESVPETQRSRLSATHNSHVNVNGGIYVAQNGSIVRTRRSSASSAKNNLKPSSPIFSSRLAKHFKKLDKMAATLEERVPLNTTKTQAGEGRHTLSTFQSCRRAASATAASSFSSSHKMLNVLNTRQSSVSLGSTSTNNTGPEEPLECPSDRTQSDEEELWMGPWNSLHIPMTKL